jgi:hypothetical protein
MITIWSKKFDAGNLMLVSLERLEAFELLILVDLPQLDGHITCTTGKHLATWMEIDIIDHTRVFSQGLLAFTSFVVP